MLSINHLKVSSDEKIILDDVSFSVKQGESLAIVGESGSGKSTLLKMFLGLPLNGLKIESGQILFDKFEINPTKHRTLLPFVGRELAWITQHANLSFNPRHKIKKHYKDLVRNHRKEISDMRSLEECLKMVGLKPEKLVDKYPFELSGGMMQLVGVALSLATRPKILLADEPTSALDVLSKKELIGTLSNLHQQESISLIFVTHDISIARKLAERVIVMEKGKIVEMGTRNSVLHQPQQAYTQKLLAAIPKLAYSGQ